MDAYGNFTSMADFKDGQLVHFISYLDPMICMGFRCNAHDYSCDAPWDLVVRRLDDGGSVAERSWTVFVDASGMVRLGWPPEPDIQLIWNFGERLDIQPTAVDTGYWYSPAWLLFTMDWVDGCWFALNNSPRDHVVDISGGGVNVGNPIISFPWNGGDNQKWRCCLAPPL